MLPDRQTGTCQSVLNPLGEQEPASVSVTVAVNQDNKTSKSSLGRYPYTPAPEEPAPEHSPREEETAENLEELSCSAESVNELLKPTTNQPAIMADQDSIKMTIKPPNNTNFTTWLYKVISALAYKGLNEYVLEDTSKYVSQADYSNKK
ncbi:hypothetical protein PCANC_10090 [Puccinia coronata f. sp. avenae]|uniref:Uncharacterized protein n=1 Tax=Puccinia coronata f. sp. avenae TaxID=200324 RepID=A0A2N5V7A9_9BASI|nr:hypothetical protein PCANC_10090 [Puccinia coronata f. sp. avenae]